MSEKKSIESLTCCDASRQMLKIAAEKGIETVFDRAADMRPCPIGAAGICCKNCAMGPCRVPLAKGKQETAGAVGKLIAERLIQKGVNKVVFDRNGFLYHGRVKAVSEGARKAGLDF